MNRIIFALTVFFLAACGSGNHAGGSGVDIPNSVTVVALQSNGSPVRKAKVRIVSESKWMYYRKMEKSVVVDSTRTNDQGEFSFVPPENEKIRIEIVTEIEGVSCIYDSTKSTVELSALGSIQLQWVPNGRVDIAGTSFTQVADSAGTITFQTVPGLNSFFVGEEMGDSPVILTSFEIENGQRVDVGKVQALPRYLTVDDFDEKSITTKLNPYVNGSYWFTVADEDQGGESVIFPSTAKAENWSSAFSDSGTYSGKSLVIGYQIKPSDVSSLFAILGCSITNGINGQAIDSIAFVAATDGAFALLGGKYTLLQGDATLNAEWERFSINRALLDSIGVDSIMDVIQFVFSDVQGTKFWLDDLIIYGDPFELLANE